MSIRVATAADAAAIQAIYAPIVDRTFISFETQPPSLEQMRQSIETARVKFFDKGEAGRLQYALSKLAAELLSRPARLAGRGHDMMAYLRRN